MSDCSALKNVSVNFGINLNTILILIDGQDVPLQDKENRQALP